MGLLGSKLAALAQALVTLGSPWAQPAHPSSLSRLSSARNTLSSPLSPLETTAPGGSAPSLNLCANQKALQAAHLRVRNQWTAMLRTVLRALGASSAFSFNSVVTHNADRTLFLVSLSIFFIPAE
jgi:hypothetical protein